MTDVVNRLFNDDLKMILYLYVKDEIICQVMGVVRELRELD